MALSLRLKLSANTLSVLGLCCGVLAALAYARLPEPEYVLTGFILMLVWHVLDGADGRLARRTGTASTLGRVLDGLCDHVTFVCIYIVFALSLIASGWPTLNAWALTVAAGASHAVQSAGYEARRYQYVRRLRKLENEHTESNNSDNIWQSLVVLLAQCYAWLQALWVRPESVLDSKLQQLWAMRHSTSDQEALLLVRNTKTLVKAWSVFNPNKRTFLIAALAAWNLPAIYFVLELSLFNLLFVFLTLCEQPYEKALLQGFRRRLA